MSEDRIEIVILAAGLGTRMKSKVIKILHHAGGRAIIDYVLELANGVSEALPILVVGHQREFVETHCAGRARYAFQNPQLGTGHAVLQAAPLLPEGDVPVLVLSGDVPLMRPETLRLLADTHRNTGAAATLLSFRPDDPGAYGRIVRDEKGDVIRIVEARDASPEELQIGEVNAGTYMFSSRDLIRCLRSLSTFNAQGEYYLTDVISILREEGRRISAVVVDDPIETLGVNSRQDLAVVEAELTRRHVTRLMRDGVTFRNPSGVVIDTTVSIGADTIVYPFVTLEGQTVIGRGCVIEPGCHIRDTRVEDGVVLRTGTVAHHSIIEEGASAGPYAHLRSGTVLGRSVRIGNFVETKKAVFGAGAKASHLSYIGDAEVGSGVNIGAGTITCNYDGEKKHQTVIEDGAFIGSDTQLVAPVRVGRGAYVGAGSTITKDVPPGALALSRTPQRIVENWAERKTRKKDT